MKKLRRNRILWNRRGHDIDEIVIHDATVHIEQMGDNCWWIGITSPRGYWAGNFSTKRAPMWFWEQDREGDIFDDDETHEVGA